jgi:hypothetical protein
LEAEKGEPRQRNGAPALARPGLHRVGGFRERDLKYLVQKSERE